MLLAAAGVVTAALAVRKSSTVAAPISRSVKARKPGGDSVSLAFLGCGSIANHHLSAVISSGAGVVRALCDPNTANRDNLRARIQSETDWESPLEFRSLEEALTSSACEFDAVAILVPNHLHESTALAAIAAGKHVLLEKPIALDVAGGQRIISAAEAAGVVCWVAENAAFWHEILVAKSVIDSCKLGKVLTARAKLWESTYSQWSEDYVPGSWRTDMKRAGGGYVFDSGTHWVRPLRMWCGDADSVVASVGTSVVHMPHSMAHAIIRMKSGLTTSFEAILSEAPLSHQPWFVIQCEGGEIVIDGAFDGGYGVKVFSKEHPTGAVVTATPEGWSTSYSNQMRAFLAKCSGPVGVPDVGSAREGLKDLELLTAMIKSSECGSWVKLSC